MLRINLYMDGQMEVKTKFKTRLQICNGTCHFKIWHDKPYCTILPVPPAINPTFLALLTCTGSLLFSLIENLPVQKRSKCQTVQFAKNILQSIARICNYFPGGNKTHLFPGMLTFQMVLECPQYLQPQASLNTATFFPHLDTQGGHS